MKPTFNRILGLAGLGLVALAGSAQAGITRGDDPEDSPLYAVSRVNAFTDMEARDKVTAGVQMNYTAGVEAGEVIVAQGTTWYKLPPNVAVTQPRWITTGYPSCSGGPTCNGAYTCSDPPGPSCVSGMVTCLSPTCGTAPSCSLVNTCYGPPYSTCGYTCTGATCAGTCTAPTCSGATCSGTCVPANCQTALYGISIPQAGQIQFSFSSSAQLKYELECCTNPGAGAWCEVCSTNGNGSVLTLCHTNGAPVALYRLIIQNP